MARCPACVATQDCGFCASTFQCVKGNTEGPLDQFHYCPTWAFTVENCPEVPNCSGYPDCGSCAQVEACAWCAAENLCVTISEAFSKDCSSLVFNLPCPDSYVPGKLFFSSCLIFL